jgi:peptide/nickel transport system substrate-binding protein
MRNVLSRLRGKKSVVMAVVVALVAAASVAVTSVGRAGTSATPKPVKGGTIVVGVDAESPPGWDPANNTIGLSGQIVQGLIFDSIMSPSPDGSYKPQLAQTVNHNKNNTVWTIVLRPNLKFQDGTALDAKATVAFMRRFHDKSSSNGAEYSGFVKSFKAVGKRTVIITTYKPKGAMPLYLSGPLGNIASPASYKKLGKSFSQHPVGAGPYKMTEWVVDDHMTLKRWPGYFRKDQPYADTIVIRPIPNEAARASAVKAGDVDIMFTQNPTDIKNFRTDSSVTETEIPYGTTSLYLNLSKPPFNDIRARQAVAYALNKQQLIDTVWNGIGNVVNTPFKKGTVWYKQITKPWDKQDLAKARQLVSQYESATGRKLTFSLISRVSATERSYAQALQAQLRAAGMTVNIDPLTDDNTYISKIFDNSYEMATRLHQGFLDPEFQISRLHLDGGAVNVEHYTTPALESALQTGIQASDIKTRKAAYDKVQQILADNVVGIFVRSNTVGVVARKNIRGNFDWRFPDGSKGLGHFYPTFVNPDSLWKAK